MADQLTLIADLAESVPGAIGFEIRHVNRTDRDALGRLYFESYDPGIACDTLEDAIADIQASFDGKYGPLLEDASWVALDGGSLMGAVLTVHRPTWAGFPDCPLIIELFVDRAHRRLGIGRELVRRVMTSLLEAGETRLALHVNVENRPARALYESLGFVNWSPDDGS